MHIFDSAIIPRFFLPEKNEGHLLNQAIHDSLKTCLNFGSTSKDHYKLINSPSFCQALISAIGFHRLFLESHPSDDQKPGILARQFRQLTQWKKGIYVGKNQEFMGSGFADVYSSQAGVELFLFHIRPFSQNQVLHLLLEGESHSIIEIPQNIRVATKEDSGFTSHVACSQNFITINRGSDSAVFCFSRDKKFQKHYELKNEIMGLTIRGNSLYIREWTSSKAVNQNQERIFIGDLNSSENNLSEFLIPHHFANPSVDYTFGESYLVLMDNKQLIAAPLNLLTNWIIEEQPQPFSYILPYEQDFIGIVLKINKIDIVKIKILESERRFQNEIIAEGIKLDGEFVAVHLHLGRLFFACKKFLEFEIQIYSYDLETKELKNLFSLEILTASCSFRPRIFHSTIEKMHYLDMGINFLKFCNQVEIKSYLTSIDYKHPTQASLLNDPLPQQANGGFISNSQPSKSNKSRLKREREQDRENENRPQKRRKNE